MSGIVVHRGSGGGGGGKVVQVVNTQDGAVATGTTTMPHDDTLPQNTEGDEYMTLAITPQNTANKLLIQTIAYCSNTNTPSILTVALFQDSTANALAAVTVVVPTGTFEIVIPLTYFMSAGTTSSTTFKVRIGASSAGTTTFNGESGVRKQGGAIGSSITITEVAA